VVSNALEHTMQIERSSDDTYDQLAEAGCRRFIQVVSKSIVGLQTARMIRNSAAGQSIAYISCSATAEADALLG